MMPTRLPSWASATATFTATVVFPTPPLPAPTAITFFTPGTGTRPPSGTAAVRTAAVISTLTDDTPGTAATSACACACSRSFTGHAGVVSSIANATAPASETSRRFTNPRLTMSFPRSGSMTPRSASSTAA